MHSKKKITFSLQIWSWFWKALWTRGRIYLYFKTELEGNCESREDIVTSNSIWHVTNRLCFDQYNVNNIMISVVQHIRVPYLFMQSERHATKHTHNKAYDTKMGVYLMFWGVWSKQISNRICKTVRTKATCLSDFTDWLWQL